MQSLDKIRRRIKSIKMTAKITGAMKLVAVAKMKQLTNNYKQTATFIKDFYKIMGQLFLDVDQKQLDRKTDVKKKLWILITSSLGLCGSYNIAICKETFSKMNSDDDLIVIGRKGVTYFKAKKMFKNITNQYDFVDQNLNHYIFLPIIETLISNFNTNKYSKINLCYTSFVNSLVSNPKIIQLLPLQRELFVAKDTKAKYTSLTEDKKEILYENNKANIITSITPLYLTTLLFGAYSESRLCEYAARRNAMENATDNANDLIDKLTLQYNVVRQQNITQEINEIVGGANAGE